MNGKSAINGVLVIVAAVTLFHFCILLKIIPYEITWGGRLTNDQEMYVFEAVSLIINAYLGFILLIKGHFIKPYLKPGIIRVSLWVYLILFAINTVGNLLAKTNFEKYFAILTLALSLLLWIILRSKDMMSQQK